MKNLLETIGVITFSIGLMAADSECLLYPIGLLLAGFLIYKLSGKVGE